MLIDSTWRSWYSFPQSPYNYEEIEVVREEWKYPMVISPHKLPSELNIIGLYWRPLVTKEPTEAPMASYMHEAEDSTPLWEKVLEEWSFIGKITKEECTALIDLVTDDLWLREQKGYNLGRGYKGRMQHGETV